MKIRKVIDATLDEEITYKKYELEKINEVGMLIVNKGVCVCDFIVIVLKHNREYSRHKTCWINYGCALFVTFIARTGDSHS